MWVMPNVLIPAQSLMFMNIGVTSSAVSDESAEGNYNGQSFYHITHSLCT